MSSMTNTMLARAILGLTAAATLALGANGALAAADPPDRVLQVDRYTSDKGRALGQKFQGPLRDLNAKVYHCMPWLEVKTEGIGFDMLKEPTLEGFTVIVSWLKAEPTGGQPPVLETAAAFMPKALVENYLRGRASIAQLADGAHVLAWDGETKIGSVKPRAWADDFV